MNINDKAYLGTSENNNSSKIDQKELDKIIQSVEFPDDYDAFDDELLDMIPNSIVPLSGVN